MLDFVQGGAQVIPGFPDIAAKLCSCHLPVPSDDPNVFPDALDCLIGQG